MTRDPISCWRWFHSSNYSYRPVWSSVLTNVSVRLLELIKVGSNVCCSFWYIIR